MAKLLNLLKTYKKWHMLFHQTEEFKTIENEMFSQNIYPNYIYKTPTKDIYFILTRYQNDNSILWMYKKDQKAIKIIENNRGITDFETIFKEILHAYKMEDLTYLLYEYYAVAMNLTFFKLRNLFDNQPFAIDVIINYKEGYGIHIQKHGEDTEHSENYQHFMNEFVNIVDCEIPLYLSQIMQSEKRIVAILSSYPDIPESPEDNDYNPYIIIQEYDMMRKIIVIREIKTKNELFDETKKLKEKGEKAKEILKDFLLLKKTLYSK